MHEPFYVSLLLVKDVSSSVDYYFKGFVCGCGQNHFLGCLILICLRSCLYWPHILIFAFSCILALLSLWYFGREIHLVEKCTHPNTALIYWQITKLCPCVKCLICLYSFFTESQQEIEKSSWKHPNTARPISPVFKYVIVMSGKWVPSISAALHCRQVPRWWLTPI